MFCKYFKPTLFLMICLMSVISCKKSDRDLDQDVTVTEDALNINNALNNLFIIVDHISKTEKGFNFRDLSVTPTYPIVEKDLTSSPKLLKINFNKTEGTIFLGKKFKGLLTAKFYGNFNEPGSKIIIYPQELYMDSALLKTTITVSNNGKNKMGNTVYTLAISEGQLIKNKLSTYYNSTLQYERIQGESTAIANDDVYSISGIFTGSSSKGVHFNASLTQELILKNGCYYPQSGKINIDVDKFTTRIVDFGTDCDNVVNISISKNNFTMLLK